MLDLTLNYPLDNSEILEVKKGQKVSRGYYQESMKSTPLPKDNFHNINYIDNVKNLDPHEDFAKRRVGHIEDLNEMHIERQIHHTTRL